MTYYWHSLLFLKCYLNKIQFQLLYIYDLSACDTNFYWRCFHGALSALIYLCHRNNWNVHYPDALVAMLEMWRPLVPEWILANVLTTLVYPKLQVEVENWNPLTDLVAIHTWVHPWLPLMGISSRLFLQSFWTSTAVHFISGARFL